MPLFSKRERARFHVTRTEFNQLRKIFAQDPELGELYQAQIEGESGQVGLRRRRLWHLVQGVGRPEPRPRHGTRAISEVMKAAEQNAAQSEGRLNILSLELQQISAKATRAARLAPTWRAGEIISSHAEGLRRAAPVQRPVIQYRLMAGFKMLGDAYQDAMHDRLLEVCPTAAQAGLATMVLLRLIRHVGLSGDHTNSLAEISLDAIATQCKITAPQLSKSLGYLETAGAISRQRTGRKTEVHVTPEGVYRGTRTSHPGAVLQFHKLVTGVDADADLSDEWSGDADGDDICASDTPPAQPPRRPFVPHVVDRVTEEVNRQLRNVPLSQQAEAEDRIRRSMARGYSKGGSGR